MVFDEIYNVPGLLRVPPMIVLVASVTVPRPPLIAELPVVSDPFADRSAVTTFALINAAIWFWRTYQVPNAWELATCETEIDKSFFL